MFNALSQAMISGVFGQGVLNNAVLESFTFHAWILLDFLYAENPRPDDIIAEHFFDDSEEWKSIRPEKSNLLRSVHKRVGKEVAHLTYARIGITPSEKQWQFAQIMNDVNVVFQVFLEKVDKNKLGPSWGK